MDLRAALSPDLRRVFAAFLRIRELASLAAARKDLSQLAKDPISEVKRQRDLQGGFTDSEPGSPVPDVWADGTLP